MDLENALINLGFKEITYSTEYFRTYQKDETTLFVYNNLSDGLKYFSDFSGEFTGLTDDLVIHYYNASIGSKVNERDRLSEFYENYPDIKINYPELTPIRSFNLFSLIMEKGENYKVQTFNNVKKIGDKLHFFIIDDEKTRSSFNVLGVVSYDLNTQQTEYLNYSKADRGVYFSNPQIPTKTCVIFSDISDMLFFEKTFSEDKYFLIYIPSKEFSYSQIKTIAMLSKAKAIEKVILAFPNSTEGLILDFKYLSSFYDFKLKEKFASIKVEIPQTENADKFILRLKDLENSLNSNLRKANNKIELISIKKGTAINNSPVFIVEIQKVANVLKAVLTLIKQYLLQGEELNIIKPVTENWSGKKKEIQKEVLSNPLKHKLILKDIRETYAFN